MKDRSHFKMHRLIQLAADDRLTPSQKRVLETHLAGCPECRAYADELKALETQLASVSVTRLVPPKARATAQQVAAIQTSYRRHTMKRQMFSAAGVLATIALVAVLILLAGRIVPRGSTPAVAPTETVGLTPFPTLTPTAEEQAHQQALAEAETQVGYPIKTLASLPAGYIFSRVVVHQPSNSVCLVYEYTRNDGYGPELWLAQGPIANITGLVAQTGFTDTQQTPVNLGGAAEAYSIYGMAREGEWACGQPQDGSDPYLRLTWQAEGQQFDLYAMGGKCTMEEGLTDLDMLRLAEGMTGIVTHAADELAPECSADLAAVEELAGFQALLPLIIPGGMEFYGASYTGAQSMLGLYYKHPDSNHTGLAIYQMPVQPELGHDLASQYRDLPADGYKFLTVADTTAVMILGDWAFNEQGGKIWFQTPGLAPTLWLERDGLLICISGPWLADGVGDPQVALIAIAESLSSAPQYQFFKHAASDTRPVETEVPGTDTGWDFNLSIAEAEQLAGFDVLEPIGMSKFLNFEVAAFDPQRHIVRLRYVTGFVLREEQFQFTEECDGCNLVGASAVVKTVKIGAVTGEYVLGVWKAIGDTGQWGWVATPYLQRLRWQVNGMAFELMYNPTHDPEAVTLADLIAIAESISSPSFGLPAEAPFKAIEPTWIPPDYQQSLLVYNPVKNITCRFYDYHSPYDGDGSLASLVVAQSPEPLPSYADLRAPFYNWSDDSPPYTETVTIGGAVNAQGMYYVQNVVDASQLCGGEQQELLQVLYWQLGDAYFAILSNPAILRAGGNTTQLEMRRIAESITGVSTIPGNVVDPERMLSIQAAENLLGIDLLEVPPLPPEYTFVYASFLERGNTRLLLVAFTNYLSFLIDFGSDLTPLEDEYNQAPLFYEKLTIRGQEALYYPGICWDGNGNAYVENCYTSQSLTWFENGMRYRIEGYKEMAKELIIFIAEGMR